jgi:P27 family predicted phage terminase small subunit
MPLSFVSGQTALLWGLFLYMAKIKYSKETKNFMKNVRAFLEQKNGGVIPAEWEALLGMLANFYEQYVRSTEELLSLDSLTVPSRYGEVPHPILKIQAQASMQVQKLCSEFGLSMKQAAKLNVIKPKEEETTIEKFLKNKVETR